MEQKIIKCSTCGLAHNPSVSLCPKCNKNEFLSAVKNGLDPFDHMTSKRILWLAILSFGMTIVVPAIAIIGISVYEAVMGIDLQGVLDGGVSYEEYIFATYPSFQTLSLFAGQLLGVIIALFIMRNYIGTVFASLKNYKNVLKSLVVVAIVIGFSAVWGIVSEKVFGVGDNTNQTIVVNEVLSSPVFAFVSMTFLAPFIEELAFRCGAFGLVRRKSKLLAYVVSSLLFVIIHINPDTANLATELVSVPAYLVAAISLCYIYDKYGFGCSFLAHMLNNAFACIMILAFGA